MVEKTDKVVQDASKERAPEEHRYDTHDVLFKQGAPGIGIHILLSGSVDLWRQDGTEKTKLASLAQGALLGETSAFEGARHSVTAIAGEPTTALFLDAETLKKKFSDPMVRYVVNTLSARLRSSYDTSTHEKYTREVYASYANPAIRAANAYTKTVFADPIEMEAFPFRVGNNMQAERLTQSSNQLYLPLKKAPAFLKHHFEIIQRGSIYSVRDMGSTYGLLVNDTHIKKNDTASEQKLNPGENTIVVPLNSDNSAIPLEFAVFVPYEK